MNEGHEDWSSREYKVETYISTKTSQQYDGTKYITHHGRVATPHGFVEIYADASSLPCVGLRFIYRGRLYGRSWKRYFRPRTIVTLAKRFASDVIAQLKEPA